MTAGAPTDSPVDCGLHDTQSTCRVSRPLLSVEAATGIEPVMKVLQTSALPLGYAAGDYFSGKIRWVERETGFEPATSTLARSHSTTELFPLASPCYSRHPGRLSNHGVRRLFGMLAQDPGRKASSRCSIRAAESWSIVTAMTSNRQETFSSNPAPIR